MLHETPRRTNRNVLGLPLSITVSFEHEFATRATLSRCAGIPRVIGVSTVSTVRHITTASTARGDRTQARAPDLAT